MNNYLNGSSLVSSITNNLGFGISKYYEDNRNLIIGVSNYFGANNISTFVYDNDALGRSSQRIDANYANSIAITNTFEYNQHQEQTWEQIATTLLWMILAIGLSI